MQRLFDEALLVQETKRAHSSDLFADIGRPYPDQKSTIFTPYVAMGALAITCALALVLFWPRDDPNRGSTGIDATTDIELASDDSSLDALPKNECAVLTSAVNAEWSGELAPHPGDTLGPCDLHLEKGVVQLEFCSGATVVLESPADFRIESSEGAICKKGKVHVHAPALAAGFVISVPGMDVVDLGTEFAVRVTETGLSEVHVLDGEVSLESTQTADGQAPVTKKLVKGESVAFDGQKELRALPEADDSPPHEQFIDGERLSLLSTKRMEERLEAWKNRGPRIMDNESTIVDFDFSPSSPWSRTLTNLAIPTEELASGAIIGCAWREGRWPGKSSIEFKGVSDRVRFSIPGEFDSISYVAWVSIDGFNRKRNALVLTDGWEVGEPHWQIGKEGELVLGLSESFNPTRGVFEGRDYKSDPVLDRSDLGRWIHLATVYNGETNEVIHYADGRRLNTLPVRKSTPIKLGSMEIGNWRPQDQTTFLTRAFNGRIDELAILSRPLSDEEVEAAYELGRIE